MPFLDTWSCGPSMATLRIGAFTVYPINWMVGSWAGVVQDLEYWTKAEEEG